MREVPSVSESVGADQGTDVFDERLVFSAQDGRALVADLGRPYGAQGPLPVIVLVHGGGWVSGSREDYGAWARFLCAQGYATLRVDYTLAAPGAPSWPAAFMDVVAALDHLRDSADTHGLDPSRMAGMGTSAGAHLLACAQLATGALRSVVLVNGVYDLIAQQLWSRAAGRRDAVGLLMGSDPAALPDAFVHASPARLVTWTRECARRATWLLVTGDCDEVVPAEQAVAFSNALSTVGAGVDRLVIEGASHLWTTTTPVDQGHNATLAGRLLDVLKQELALHTAQASPAAGGHHGQLKGHTSFTRSPTRGTGL